MNAATENDVMMSFESCFLDIRIKRWRQLSVKHWKYNDFLRANENGLVPTVEFPQ